MVGTKTVIMIDVKRLISANVQLSTLEARRNRLQSMCNGRFDVNKYSEQAIQLFNDIDKVISYDDDADDDNNNKYVSPPYCRTDMYAGRVACCPC